MDKKTFKHPSIKRRNATVTRDEVTRVLQALENFAIYGIVPFSDVGPDGPVMNESIIQYMFDGPDEGVDLKALQKAARKG